MVARQRERKVAVVIGAAGSGKTTCIVRPLIDRYTEAGGHVRALDPPPGTWEWGEWPGYSGIKDWLTQVKGVDADGHVVVGSSPFSGLLVLDDCDRYVSAQSFVKDGWRDLWVANRHFHIDILAVTHRPQELPKVLLASCAELWIFCQDEAYAVDYLLDLPALKKAGVTELPDVAGTALRVTRGQPPELVKFFEPE